MGWGAIEFNISSTALLPFPTCNDFCVITLLDGGARQRVDIHPLLPFLLAECELKTWWCSSKSLRVTRGGGGSCCSSVVASCSLQCWPSIRDLWTPGPWPPRILSRQFALHKPAFTLHFLPLTDCPCTSHWGFLLLHTQTQRHVTHHFRMPAELVATDLRSPVGMQEVNHLPALGSCVLSS